MVKDSDSYLFLLTMIGILFQLGRNSKRNILPNREKWIIIPNKRKLKQFEKGIDNRVLMWYNTAIK